MGISRVDHLFFGSRGGQILQIVYIKYRVFRIFWLALLTLGFFGLTLVFGPRLQEVNSVKAKRVAIVIDDFGGYAAGIKAMMALPHHLTFAIMPFAEFAKQQGEIAAARNFEVIVHMPFQANHADARWYGRSYIKVDSADEEIHDLILEAFRILPMAKGLSNHMGSKATSDAHVMKEVLSELKRLQRYYFDSRTARLEEMPLLIQELRLSYLKRDIFLDEQSSPQQMRGQLQKLVSIARRTGKAVGIGHVGPNGRVLAKVLAEDLPRYEEEGVSFVTLSQLLAR